jgi:hypothetical protein
MGDRLHDKQATNQNMIFEVDDKDMGFSCSYVWFYRSAEIFPDASHFEGLTYKRDYLLDHKQEF